MRMATWFADRPGRVWLGYVWALAATGACTAAGVVMSPLFEPVNIAMVYLLAVVVIALRFSRGPAIAVSILSVAAFDFFFVPPQLTFAVADAQYLVTFAIMLVVALVISALVAIVRRAETEQVRNTLLAAISHDLRTPLAVIAGASSSLAERADALTPQERKELAESIYEQSGAMADLIGNVLQMTRLNHDSIQLERDWVAPTELIGSVLRRLEERLVSHSITIEMGEDVPLVRADATLIEQIFQNLIENAARHTPAGTAIMLRACSRDGELVFSVEDAGPGLPPGDPERLFDKFERGRSEGIAGGVGLGLAISRAIVHLHGGKIWAERLPAGAAFRFTLPIEEAPAGPAEAGMPGTALEK